MILLSLTHRLFPFFLHLLFHDMDSPEDSDQSQFEIDNRDTRVQGKLISLAQELDDMTFGDLDHNGWAGIAQALSSWRDHIG